MNTVAIGKVFYVYAGKVVHIIFNLVKIALPGFVLLCRLIINN